MRDSFIFYRSFFEALRGMSSDNQGDCLMAVADYALNGKEPDNPKPEVRMFFTLVKPQIDANNQRFENGKKGGRPKNQKITEIKPKNNQEKTKTEPNDNDNENDNYNLNNKNNLNNNYNNNLNNNIFMDLIPEKQKKSEKRFQKPTLEEVKSYCQERDNKVDAEKWFDFYSSNGWKVGKNPMKDWKAAVRTWEKSSNKAQSQETTWQRNMRIMREMDLENQREVENGKNIF